MPIENVAPKNYPIHYNLTQPKRKCLSPVFHKGMITIGNTQIEAMKSTDYGRIIHLVAIELVEKQVFR